MLHEFADPIPVETPLGKGVALFIETSAHDAHWTVALRDSRAIVTFRQQQLRIGRNYSLGLGLDDTTMKDIVS